jgi:ribosomal-protein-alanine N-acetyltransferase
MIKSDLNAVCRIESDSFDNPWCADDFVHCLRKRNVIGVVAEIDGQVVGYTLYAMHRRRFDLINIAVAKSHLRCYVGTAMIDKLIAKTFNSNRPTITVKVRESNLTAQLFFRRLGFVAVSTIRGAYVDSDEDAYLLRLCQLESFSVEKEEVDSVR